MRARSAESVRSISAKVLPWTAQHGQRRKRLLHKLLLVLINLISRLGSGSPVFGCDCVVNDVWSAEFGMTIKSTVSLK